MDILCFMEVIYTQNWFLAIVWPFLGSKKAVVNILATNPVCFPTPTVEDTCFLPQFSRARMGVRKNLYLFWTKVAPKILDFTFPKVIKWLKLGSKSKSREEIWEIGGNKTLRRYNFLRGQGLFSSPFVQKAVLSPPGGGLGANPAGILTGRFFCTRSGPKKSIRIMLKKIPSTWH